MLAAIVRASLQIMCVSGGVFIAAQYAKTEKLPRPLKWSAVICAIFCLAEHLAQFFGESRWNILWSAIAAVCALLSTTISCGTLAEFTSTHDGFRSRQTLAILREAFHQTRSLFVVPPGARASAVGSTVQLAIGVVCQTGACVYLHYFLPSPSAQLLRARRRQKVV